MFEILKEASYNSAHTMIKIALLVIPLMVVLRFAKEAGIINRVSTKLEKMVNSLYMSKNAAFPLFIGLVFGITYSTGFIIQSARELNLDGKDLLLLNVFLSLCHAVFEDTLILAAVGANPWILLGARIFLAVIITYIVGRLIHMKPEALSPIVNIERTKISR